ncbi:hypothetical protein, partial [Acidithiobacillus thiooxidans]|uniref:hypothetical protein n=1 Tax=Acidithiobacillus thiooxidans TaxID=930 RepID=UPI001D016F34
MPPCRDSSTRSSSNTQTNKKAPLPRSKLATDTNNKKGRILKGRKRLSNPPLRVGADQANAVFFQFHGKSSW